MNIKTLITFIAITLGVLLGVGGMLWQFGQNGVVKPIANIAGEMKNVKGEGELIVTEFSDFQCPGCALSQPKLKEMISKYEGKVKLVFRHFPLTSIHKHALVSAYVAEAAGLHGKFWEMHDLLFERQNQWATLNEPKARFVEYAKELGLNEETFKTDMESENVKQVVAKDLAEANRNRLMGTPSFFVDGVEMDLDQIEKKLEELDN